jgi:hypothetical protein
MCEVASSAFQVRMRLEVPRSVLAAANQRLVPCGASLRRDHFLPARFPRPVCGS